MRHAAVRTLGIALVLFAIGVTVRGVQLAMRVEDAAIFHVAIGIAMFVLLVWLASFLWRRPGGFARIVAPLVVVLLVLPVASQSWDGTRDTLRLTLREHDAFEYLRTADDLEMPAVGIGGSPSYGFIAMRIVARSKQPDAAFKELLRTGSTAGQLYALIGLRRTDRFFFESVFRAYANRTDDIGVFSGCVPRVEPIGPIVRAVNALQLPEGMTLAQWATRHPRGPWPSLDIAGGAYTSMFIDRDPRAEDVRQAELTYDFARQP